MNWHFLAHQHTRTHFALLNREQITQWDKTRHPFTFTPYLKYTSHWSTDGEPVVIHYVLLPSSCYSVFSNRVLRDLFQSSHSNIHSSPQKFNSALSPVKVAPQMKFKHFILLGGSTRRRRRRSGEAGGLASSSLSLLSALFLSLSLFFLFLLLLSPDRGAFWPVYFLFFRKDWAFCYFLFLPLSCSNLSSLPLQVSPAGNSLLNVRHAPAFFYHLFGACSHLLLSLSVGHDRVDSRYDKFDAISII